MKKFKYLLSFAAAAWVFASCEVEPMDLYSTDPVLPVMDAHADILMTASTMDELVTFSWSAARNFGEAAPYRLLMSYGGSQQELGQSSALSFTLPKSDLKTKLYGAFPTLPENDTFAVNFAVSVANQVSDAISVTIYAYGDYVAAEAAAAAESVVLDINNPTESLTLLTWEPARLAYKEPVTYNVSVRSGSVAARSGEGYTDIATNLTGTSLTMTVDQWNEAFVAAGAPEAEESTLYFRVTAFSESAPNGVPGTDVAMTVTTYLATYPDQLYVPGSYQGWDPASAPTIPQSKLTKGLFECYLDLTTADGSDVEFKLSPAPAWGDDFGSDDAVAEETANTVVVKGTVGGPGNIKAPSGIYRVSINKKFNTLEMVKIESMGLIGDATAGGWDAETPMEYDAATNTYSVTTTLKAGGYKFRANNDWSYSIGSNGAFEGGDNYAFDKADGEYKVVLDVNSHPYTVKLMSTEYPDRLYLPGGYQGWDPASAPTLGGDGEGRFEGGVNLAGEGDVEFKFSPKPAWGDDFGGTIEVTNGYGEGTYGVSDNIKVPAGYYYITVDMTAGTFTMTEVKTIGLIGTATPKGWDGDTPMTYDAAANLWTLTTELAADQFKARFNEDWGMNRGAGVDYEPYPMADGVPVSVYNNGKNLSVNEAGTYTIVLDLSTNPNTMTVTKK